MDCKSVDQIGGSGNINNIMKSASELRMREARTHPDVRVSN